MLLTALQPVASRRTLANSLEFGTAVASFLIGAEDTGGTFALVELTQRPGNEPPYHIHEREDETFYLLEGRASVMVDGQIFELEAGQTIFLPRGLPHTFRIRSEIAKTLVFLTPGGFENYFKALGSPARSLEPARDSTRIDNYFEVAGRAAARQGIRLADEQPDF